uniref:Uncharacterized protein n=1 Tax=Solanum lycopersicum TaxID=4081 RepID=A0A3Q7EAY9_SOLLC
MEGMYGLPNIKCIDREGPFSYPFHGLNEGGGTVFFMNSGVIIKFYCTGRSREKYLYFSLWNLRVQENAVWVM